MIFKRKKRKLENFNALGLINDIALPLTPFGEKITNSDVVLICIDRIASQCAKLKGRCIKRSEDGIITERNKHLSFLLKSKPNEYMTPYQFIYKVVSYLYDMSDTNLELLRTYRFFLLFAILVFVVNFLTPLHFYS